MTRHPGGTARQRAVKTKRHRASKRTHASTPKQTERNAHGNTLIVQTLDTTSPPSSSLDKYGDAITGRSNFPNPARLSSHTSRFAMFLFRMIRLLVLCRVAKTVSSCRPRWSAEACRTGHSIAATRHCARFLAFWCDSGRPGLLLNFIFFSRQFPFIAVTS